MDGIGRFAGIDWASARHAVCVIDERGAVTSRFEIEHTDAGLRELARRLKGVDGVAIERPDGPVIDALLEATPEQIASIPGFSSKSAQKILDALRASDALAPAAPVPSNPPAATPSSPPDQDS